MSPGRALLLRLWMEEPLAHLVATGPGPWGYGMARLVLQPTDLLLLLGLLFGLVAGTTLAGHQGLSPT